MKIARLAAFFLIAVLPVSSFGAKAPEIDRIEFLGVTALQKADVENVLEVNVGDRLERSKVVKTAESLINLYRAIGYDDVQVKGELGTDRTQGKRTETVLRFVIKEGLPTRVSEITLTQLGNRNSSAWKMLSEQIQSQIPIKVGMILEQDKVNTSKRVIQEVLVSDEYVGAKVDEVRIVPTKKGIADGSKWVNLEFVIDSGDRATFGFRGNLFFDRNALLGFIADQRIIGFSKDYISSIQKRIRDEYQAQGFSVVQINAFVIEKFEKNERHVTFEIQEGPRVKVESIIFDGQSIFSQQSLEDEFLSRAGQLTNKGIYVEKEVQSAAEGLIESLKSKGYLSARLVGVNRSFLEGNKEVKVVVYLYEGVQTMVEDIQLMGVSGLAKDEVVRLMGLEKGKPLNPFTLNEGLESLKQAYLNRGYLEMKVRNEDSGDLVQYSRDQRRASIVVEVDEGPIFKVRNIEITGLETTRLEVVRRELNLKEGDVIQFSSLSEAELRLRKLGIFSDVSIRVVDLDSGQFQKDIRIVMQEGSPGVLAGGFGYRQDLGARAFGQTGYTNLLGKNHEVSLGLTTNYRAWGGIFCEDDRPGCFPELQAQLNYVWPWFTGDRTTYRPRLSFERTRFKIFDSYSLSVANVWEKRLFAKPNIIATLGHNLEFVKFSNAQNAIDNQSLRIGAVIPSLRLDLRDNPLAPTQGLFAFTSFEFADPLLGSQATPIPVAYYRFQFRTDGHVPITKFTQWFLSFRTGYARNNTVAPPGTDPEEAKRYAIPLSKQFTLGGVTSLRGFQEQEWNFQSLAIRGSIGYINIRSQLDLPFAGAMRFGPFLDAGNLFVDRYVIGNFRYGGGFGFHYQSPVGPINFDLGWKLDRRPGEQPFVFYFSVGIL